MAIIKKDNAQYNIIQLPCSNKLEVHSLLNANEPGRAFFIATHSCLGKSAICMPNTKCAGYFTLVGSDRKDGCSSVNFAFSEAVIFVR